MDIDKVSMRAENDRRFKILYITDQIFVNMFCNYVLAQNECLVQHRFTTIELPEGIEVQYVFYDFNRCAWAIILYHPSFDLVPMGTIVPEIKSEVGIQVWAIKSDIRQDKVAEVASWRDLPRLKGNET